MFCALASRPYLPTKQLELRILPCQPARLPMYRAPHPLATLVRARPAGHLETSCHVSEKSNILTSLEICSLDCRLRLFMNWLGCTRCAPQV